MQEINLIMPACDARRWKKLWSFDQPLDRVSGMAGFGREALRAVAACGKSRVPQRQFS
jgi:hypothetical protein